MKILLTIALSTLAILVSAQTDIIEMRSRNASLKKYVKSSNVKSHDHVSSNFGMMPMPKVETAVLDSIKAISDSTAIVYTSTYCTRGPRLSELTIYFDSNGRELNQPKRIYGNPKAGYLWQPGADTVLNHPIFTRRHSLDSVKDVIDRDYNFNLPSDSIRFIGFDNGAGASNSDSIRKSKQKRQKKNSFGWEIIFMIISPIVFLLTMNRLVMPKSIN